MDRIIENMDIEAVRAAAEAQLNFIASARPDIDVRSGTVVRELIVGPMASIAASISANNARTESMLSLADLADDPEATVADADRLLANFNTSVRQGTKSGGAVKVMLDSSDVYRVPSDMRFEDSRGNRYIPRRTPIVRSGALSEDEIALESSGGRNWFIIEVESEEIGSGLYVAPGEELVVRNGGARVASASSFAGISGGTDAETIRDALNRLRYRLPKLSLDTPASTRALLEDNGIVVQSISAAGFGSGAQRYGRDNVMGVYDGTGVSYFIRTYMNPVSAAVVVSGTHIGGGDYALEIKPSDIVGTLLVRSVASYDTDTGDVLGSYEFDETRSGDYGEALTPEDPARYENTVRQTVSIIAKDVAMAPKGGWDGEHRFVVELYVEPRLAEIQELFHRPAYKPFGFDCTAYGAVPCVVSVHARVKASPGTRSDKLSRAVADYINGGEFGGKLPLSGVVSALHSAGATVVDERNGISMTGRIRKAGGEYMLLGPGTLDITSVSDPVNLVSADTTTFLADPENIVVEILQGD